MIMQQVWRWKYGYTTLGHKSIQQNSPGVFFMFWKKITEDKYTYLEEDSARTYLKEDLARTLASSIVFYWILQQTNLCCELNKKKLKKGQHFLVCSNLYQTKIWCTLLEERSQCPWISFTSPTELKSNSPLFKL